MGEFATFLPILLLGLAFYFLLIRPQSKRAKKQREMQASLASGTTIMLTSGIFGELVATDDPERVDVRIADGVVVTVARAAIASTVDDRVDQPSDEPVEGHEPGEDVTGRRDL